MTSDYVTLKHNTIMTILLPSGKIIYCFPQIVMVLIEIAGYFHTFDAS